MSAIKPTYEELVQRLRELEEEVTTGQQLQIELRESKARYKALFEKAPEATIVIDVETVKFVDANTAALRLFGHTREELISIGPLDVSPPVQLNGRASEESAQEKIQEILSENPKPFEWMHKNASGKEFLCEIYHAKLPVPGRKLHSSIAIDITEIKRSEEKLQKAHDDIRLLKEKLEQENIYLREKIEIKYRHHNIVGESSAIKSILSQAEMVSEQTTCVLIQD